MGTRAEGGRGPRRRPVHAFRVELAFAVAAFAMVVRLAPVAQADAPRTAVVGTTSFDEAAVAYVVASVEGASRRDVPALDPMALRRWAAQAGVHIVVRIDAQRGRVVALRTRDGRLVERRLDPALAARSAYAVALVAVELVEVLATEVATRLRRPVRPTAPAYAFVARAGPALSIALDGDVVSPRLTANVGLRTHPARWPVAIELVLGVSPAIALDHDVEPPGEGLVLTATGSVVRYTRHDVTASAGVWTSRARLSLGGGVLGSVGLVTARALDALGATLGDHRRVVASAGGFVGARVRLGSGFFLGLSWSVDGQPAPRRYLVLSTPALDEGAVRMMVGLDVGWDSGDL